MKHLKPTIETIWDDKFNLSSTSLGFLIWELNNTIETKMNQMLREFGITRFQFYILQSLKTSKDHKLEFTQNEFANFIHANNMMVSKVLRQMEIKNLIQRTPSTKDGRAMVVSLTPTGLKMYSKTAQKVQQNSQQIRSKFMDNSDFSYSIQQLILTIKS
jgi:DNA-binding MarR family transcriptional regulator